MAPPRRSPVASPLVLKTSTGLRQPPQKKGLLEIQKTGTATGKPGPGNLLKQYDLYGRLLPPYPYPIQSWQIGTGLTWVAGAERSWSTTP
ncbi:MAG: hypothetical protein Ct9H300mP1_27700 [Planctomycetaceae bacterium]|nr:MAG: hypothetical protein Ct9H300mP1_27700 [Planctomycetaceae bacterium]